MQCNCVISSWETETEKYGTYQLLPHSSSKSHTIHSSPDTMLLSCGVTNRWLFVFANSQKSCNSFVSSIHIHIHTPDQGGFCFACSVQQLKRVCTDDREWQRHLSSIFHDHDPDPNIFSLRQDTWQNQVLGGGGETKQPTPTKWRDGASAFLWVYHTWSTLYPVKFLRHHHIIWVGVGVGWIRFHTLRYFTTQQQPRVGHPSSKRSKTPGPAKSWHTHTPSGAASSVCSLNGDRNLNLTYPPSFCVFGSTVWSTVDTLFFFPPDRGSIHYHYHYHWLLLLH